MRNYIKLGKMLFATVLMIFLLISPRLTVSATDSSGVLGDTNVIVMSITDDISEIKALLYIMPAIIIALILVLTILITRKDIVNFFVKKGTKENIEQDAVENIPPDVTNTPGNTSESKMSEVDPLRYNQHLRSVSESLDAISGNQERTNKLLSTLTNKLDTMNVQHLGVLEQQAEKIIYSQEIEGDKEKAENKPNMDYMKEFISYYKDSINQNIPLKYLKIKYNVLPCGVPEYKRNLVANDQMPKDKYTEFENGVEDGRLLAVFFDEDQDKCFIVPDPNEMFSSRGSKSKFGYYKIFNGVSDRNKALEKPAAFGRIGHSVDFNRFIDKGELR